MGAIEIKQVTKSFGDKTAIDNISLVVEKSEIFGLIGADGAGKSTLFDILVTLANPDTGSATVAGLDTRKDYKKLRRIIGYMPGRFSLYYDLTVYENLQFFASIFGVTIEANYHLIAEIWDQIKPFSTRPAGKLSGGMKQKLALCCALIHEPKVLFLDEPTTGVDPVSRREFWEMLGKLKQKGITIFVSTPYMDEATRCDRIALIQEGKIMAVDTPNQLIQSYAFPLLNIKHKHVYQLLKLLKTAPFTHSCYAFGQSIHLSLDNNSFAISDVEHFLTEAGMENATIETILPGIEDCFMELMKRSA